MNYPIAIYAIMGAFIMLDIVTGIAQAFFNRTIDSKILRNGMFHKLSYVFAVALALILEWACTHFSLGFECQILIPLTVYIVITEAVSILENILRLNPDLANSPLFRLLSENMNRREDDNAKRN